MRVENQPRISSGLQEKIPLVRARTQQTIRIIAGVTLASAVFGASVSSFTPDGAGIGVLTDAVIGFVLSTLALLMLGRWGRALQHWPLAVVFLLRTLIYGIVFMLVPNAMSALVHGSLAPFRDPTRVVTGTTLALSFGFAFCINFALTVSRLIGPRTMMSYVTGRYYRPRQEHRIVLFADLIGSTKLGEQLGDQKFHAFLNQVFWDMTEPVLEAGGEIDRYIGDEIIVSWLLPEGASAARDPRPGGDCLHLRDRGRTQCPRRALSGALRHSAALSRGASRRAACRRRDGRRQARDRAARRYHEHDVAHRERLPQQRLRLHRVRAGNARARCAAGRRARREARPGRAARQTPGGRIVWS